MVRVQNQGPLFVMIDDSSEKGAFQGFWPNATILVCTFHFLQQRCTWLHDASNRIHGNDQICLIQKVKSLVYAKSVQDLTENYQDFLRSLKSLNIPNSHSTYNLCGSVGLNGLTVIVLMH